MKNTSLWRFADAEENQMLLVGTILDPRFKEKFFSGPVITERAISRVLKKTSSINTGSESPNNEPSPKRPYGKAFRTYFRKQIVHVSSEGGLHELDAYLAERAVTLILEERAVTAGGPITGTGFHIWQKLHSSTYVLLQHQWSLKGCFQGQVMFMMTSKVLCFLYVSFKCVSYLKFCKCHVKNNIVISFLSLDK